MDPAAGWGAEKHEIMQTPLVAIFFYDLFLQRRGGGGIRYCFELIWTDFFDWMDIMSFFYFLQYNFISTNKQTPFNGTEFHP